MPETIPKKLNVVEAVEESTAVMRQMIEEYKKVQKELARFREETAQCRAQLNVVLHAMKEPRDERKPPPGFITVLDV